MTKAVKVIGGFLGIAIVAVIIGSIWSLVGGSHWATAQVDEVAYTFRLADSPLEHAKGLSGMSIGQLEADGMLFVFPDEQERVFTMRGMQFNLDILWIRDNKIMDIDYDVAAPVGGQKPVNISSDPLLADMVIEVPAGHAQEMNFQIGHTLVINLDASAGK